MTISELIKALSAVPNQEAEARLQGVILADGDFTGGASEDLFTATGHGLSDGDTVSLLAESAAGVVTGAVGDRFVVEQLSSSTFQLKDDDGNVIENTADGTAVFGRVSGMAVDTAGATSATFAPDAPDAEMGANGSRDPGYVEIG